MGQRYGESIFILLFVFAFGLVRDRFQTPLGRVGLVIQFCGHFRHSGYHFK